MLTTVGSVVIACGIAGVRMFSYSSSKNVSCAPRPADCSAPLSSDVVVFADVGAELDGPTDGLGGKLTVMVEPVGLKLTGAAGARDGTSCGT